MAKTVPGPDVVAQHTGQREGDDEEEVDKAGLLTVPAGQLHAAADDVLEDGQHGGKRRKGHEQEEQAAPQTAHRHIGEDVGQGDEDEAGAAGLVHAVSEAGGKMMRPAVMATKVSSTTTRTLSPSRACSLPM